MSQVELEDASSQEPVETVYKGITDQVWDKYRALSPKPITKSFIRKYILSKLDFPTKDSELAESLIQLNAHIDALFNEVYVFEKIKLEIEDLELQIEELGELGMEHGLIAHRRTINQASLLELELSRKHDLISKTNLNMINHYNETMEWKGCVEDIAGEMGITSLDSFNFSHVRMDEMSAKIKKWGELQANEMLEMTADKLRLIHDSQDDFNKGFYKGKVELEYQNYQLQISQLEQQIQDLSTQEEMLKQSGKIEDSWKIHNQIIQTTQDLRDKQANLSQIERIKTQIEAEEK